MTRFPLNQILSSQIESTQLAVLGSKQFLGYLTRKQPLSSLPNGCIVMLIELLSAQIRLLDGFFNVYNKLSQKTSITDEEKGLMKKFETIGLDLQKSYREHFIVIEHHCKNRINEILQFCKPEIRDIYLSYSRNLH